MSIHYHMKIEGPTVMLSIAVSFVGAYAAITTFEQYRLCRYLQIKPRFGNIDTLLKLIAISLGGVAIWTMHFVGMSSCTLHYLDGTIASISYRIDLTITSLIAVIILCYGGLRVSSRDDMFVKDRTDAVEAFFNRSKEMSIAEVRSQSKAAFLIQSLTYNLVPIVLAGLFTATGVCVMHYVGMMAMQFDGWIEWNPSIIAASVLIALFASTAAFWILFRLLVLFPKMECLRVASAVVAAIAVNGMHYCGMAAATFVYDATGSYQHNKIDERNLVSQIEATHWALAVGMATVVFVFGFVMSDLRHWFYGLASITRELDLRIAEYDQVGDTFASKHPFVEDYVNLRKAAVLSGKGIIKYRLSHQNRSIPSQHSNVVVPVDEYVQTRNDVRSKGTLFESGNSSLQRIQSSNDVEAI